MIYELREPVTALSHRDHHEGRNCWRSPTGIYLCHSGIRRMFLLPDGTWWLSVEVES